MKTLKIMLAAIAAAGLVPAASAEPASAPNAAIAPWSVFVDLPTRFVFVKTPSGWKFIEQLSEQQVAELGPAVLTSLLPPEEVADRYPTSVAPSPALASGTSFGEGRKAAPASLLRFRRARDGRPALMLPPQN